MDARALLGYVIVVVVGGGSGVMFFSSKQSAKDRLFIYKQSQSRSVGERKTALMFFNLFSELTWVKLVVEY